jgi:hypothetical protein
MDIDVPKVFTLKTLFWTSDVKNQHISQLGLQA